MNETYNFHYTDGETRSIQVSCCPGATWPEVLEQFVGFMSNVYGYDIRGKIAIADPFLLHDDSWYGPVFNPEDSL